MVVLGIYFLWIPMALQGGALSLHFKKVKLLARKSDWLDRF